MQEQLRNDVLVCLALTRLLPSICLRSHRRESATQTFSTYSNERKVPESLKGEGQNDPLYGDLTVLFRRVSGSARLTLFDGGHAGSDQAALRWLSLQRKGKPADWSVASPTGSTVQTSEVPK